MCILRNLTMRPFFVSSFIVVCFLFGNRGEIRSTPLFQVEKADSLNRAIESLEASISSDPENLSLHLRLGTLYLSVEDWHKADVSFRRCLQLDENSAEAYNGLGLAYHGKGESSIIPIEVIKKLFKIDNYSKAEKQYKRALELNPDYLDPLYNMGVNYLAKSGENNYQRSVESLKKVLEKNMEFKDADLMLGIAYQHLKDYVNAEVVLKRVIETNRTVGKAMLRLSDIYLDTGREDEATDMYYDGVVRIRDPKTWDNIYAELEMLMESEERNRFINLSLEDKGNFIRKFWKKKDPVPTTRKNERLIEHFRRVYFVRNTYPDVIPPYYDDRGKVYVKYGPPDIKFTAQMLDQGVKDNESWSYEKSVRPGLTFDFVKRGTGYYRVQDLSDAAPTGSGSDARFELLRRLYAQRADFTESYNRFALEGLGHGEDIQNATANFRNVMINFQAERDVAEEMAPVETYKLEPEGRTIPFIYNLSQFRSSEGKSRLELYMGISNDQLKYIPVDRGMVTSLKYNAVIQDSEYVDVHNMRRAFNLRARSTEEIQGKLFIHQEDFELSPGKYLLAIQVENPQGNSQGLYQNEFEARDFSGSSLMISDIQLASDIDPVESVGKFVKKNLKITPYPYTVVRRKRPIFIYFEVYNLKFMPNGQTNYTVTHTVDVLDHKRSFFSKTFGAIGRIFKKGQQIGISTSYQQSGTELMTSEYISLDMGKIPKGVAKLTVMVMDNSTGEKTSQSIQLQIIE